MTSRKKRGSEGFSLMELLVSMALLLVISATAFSAMNGFSRTYSTTMTMADMDSGLRNAAELVTQEIGQAGNVPYSSQNLGGAVTGSASPQTVTITSTINMYVGQMLQVDTGAVQENVQITAIPSSTTITAKFANSHATGAPIDPSGVFPHGILLNSTSTQLNMMGDLNGDGTLEYVVYTCAPNSSGTGTLTRSVSPLTATSLSTSTVLLQNLVTNPGAMGNTCFTIPTATVAGSYSFITSVGVTLSTQSTYRDQQTGEYGTLTKSFMNIAPRNILAGVNMATINLSAKLDPDPATLP
jgi:prepilin-type N-terminal cleavage/methylation domain-containing protein